MLPDPLHPMVVHFPVVLAVALPLAAVGALWAVRRGAAPLRAWGAVAGLGLALFVSSWVAVRTGEAQEERVEEVVAESVLHEHEEAGERFLWIAGLSFLVIGAGLLPGRGGELGRVAGTVAAVAVLGFGWQVGHSGGELVYRHGAPLAYVGTVSGTGADRDAGDVPDGDAGDVLDRGGPRPPDREAARGETDEEKEEEREEGGHR